MCAKIRPLPNGQCPASPGALRIRRRNAEDGNRKGSPETLQRQHHQCRSLVAELSVPRRHRNVRRRRKLRQSDASGFIQIYGLPTRVMALTGNKE